uniref:LAM_G_DOMAIN domain-containing protein n=1 Tax=Echinostoma caproni TaxID=27848 RepID=A0A183BCK9_9TREM
LLISAQSGDVTQSYVPSKETNLSEITIIEIRQGYVEYSIHLPISGTQYRVGSRTVLRIRSDRSITDGQCHTIHIARSQKRATLITDHHMVSGEFQDTYLNYNPNNVVFFGGLAINNTGFPSDYQNFTGCVGDVFVNEHSVQLLTTASELRGPVEPCQ